MSEGRVEDRSLYAVAIDLQSLEERLVQRTPTTLVGADVEVVTGGKKAKRNLEAFFTERMIDAGELDQSLRIALFNRQRFLPAFQVGDRDCLGEVGIDQFLPVAVEPLEPSALGY